MLPVPSWNIPETTVSPDLFHTVLQVPVPRAQLIVMIPHKDAGERQGSLKQGDWDIMSPLSFSRLYFAQGGVQGAALESKGSQ